MQEPTHRKLSGRVVIVIIAVLFAVALAINNYNHSQQKQNSDRLTDDFIESVDP